MPSGRTHDSITLWSLPLIAGLAFERTHSASVALVLSGGFLFSGLMFGPDLDIYSQQYRRWGWLRWIWLPYRQNIRHRSFWSHGPIVGTVLRVLYLTVWLCGFWGIAVGTIAFLVHVIGFASDWSILTRQWFETCANGLGQLVNRYPNEWIGLLVGFEAGAMSHSMSDWIGSALKPAKLPTRSVATRRVKRRSRGSKPQTLVKPQNTAVLIQPRREPQLPTFGRRFRR